MSGFSRGGGGTRNVMNSPALLAVADYSAQLDGDMMETQPCFPRSRFSLLFYELLPNAPKTHLQSRLHGSWSHYLDKWHHLLIFSRPSKAHISSPAPFFCLSYSSPFPSRRPGIFRAVWKGESIEHFFSHLSILIPEWWLKCARPRNDCLSSPAGMSHQSPHYRLNSTIPLQPAYGAHPGGVYVRDCCVVVYAGCIMPKIKSTFLCAARRTPLG